MSLIYKHWETGEKLLPEQVVFKRNYVLIRDLTAGMTQDCLMTREEFDLQYQVSEREARDPDDKPVMQDWLAQQRFLDKICRGR